ncbi:MAG: carboxypeptidase regulatory-like domain-containing protein [Xanthomonadales bacterium]|nr:carboxypeptidase regulatory-like domain-containing protein [Xanthomonadales bacterium]
MNTVVNHPATIHRSWRIFCLIALFIAAPVMAQDITSAIRGTVYGEDGQPLAGASVVVEDMRTGAKRTYSTNETGAFLASRLSVGGPYQVTVNNEKQVVVDRIALGDIYYLPISMAKDLEEIVVVGQATQPGEDLAVGPAAAFGIHDIETSVAFNRDIVDVYSIDPRLNADNEDDGFAINCGGKHPRFNSITLDGVSQDDRFGLNENGYSTATGMPFPYASISQVSVELAPFDVTYGGFSACQINAVTKSGTNEWEFNAFYEYSNEDLKGDSLGDNAPGDFDTTPFSRDRWGLAAGGPIIEDRLFVYAAYEEADRPRFLARGFAGSGNGVEREWLSQSDYNRILDISRNIWGYDPGGLPGDGSQQEEKYMVRLDWNISDNHNAALIYNYYDGFQDRDSDGDSDEFEFSNHFYVKGAESETITLQLASQWTDAFSTELFFSTNEMNDSQVTVGPKDFGDFQISINRNTVYLGADDSRQANRLGTDSDFFKLAGQYLFRDHVFTFGYERDELSIFNVFVQHSRGGEWDFFDDSAGNPPHCAALSAQGRFDDPDCELSGIDRFELGRPSRVYYGSGGGTNNPFDAAAAFTNSENALYFQDEVYFAQQDLTLVAGLRYEWFDTDDSPTFNQAFTDLYGFRNDATIDGVDLLMPRIGFTWGVRDDLTLRGGFGRYSGGNPNVWISNSYSNDGITNVQLRNNYFDCCSVFDGSIPIGPNPGFDVPQDMIDEVAATSAADANNSFLALVDPDYEQPNEWKFALGATYDLPWWDIQMDIDYLHSEVRDPAYYVDLSQEIVGTTTTGIPIYDYVRGRDNFMLTNSDEEPDSDVISLVFTKAFQNGLDLQLGYAHTKAEDVSPMTSSVAGSNFDNTALLDVNDPEPATSNYVVPHRFTLRATYAHEFFSGYETRFSLFGYHAEGQPQSYVMGSNDLEGDGFFGRHLLYVPTGPEDDNVVFEEGFDQTAFFDWVARNGLAPGFVERNGRHADWSTRFDFRIDQEIPTFIDDTRGRLFMKIYNLGNLLNDDWGLVTDAQFFSVQVVNSGVNDLGQFVYERFRDRSINDVLENRSLWDVLIGVEIDF